MDSCTKRPPTKRVLSICSGIGGIELGLAALEPITGERFETICYLELEISAGRVLAKNIQEGKLGDAPIWTDIRTFNTEPWSNKVDIIVGGFPCQPHSQAGKQLHGDDPRELSGEVLRIAAGLGYPTLFLENVQAYPATTGITYDPNYERWVTGLRRHSALRRKSGLLKRGPGFLSWPTPTAMDRPRTPETMAKSAAYRKETHNKNTVPLYLGEAATNWPTPQVQNWMTPNTMDTLPPKSQETLTREHDKARPGRLTPNNLRDQVAVQEGITNWPTPDAYNDPIARGRLPIRTVTPRGKQIHLHHAAKNWPTPTSGNPSNTNSQRGADTLYGRIETWPTPTASEDKSSARMRREENLQDNLSPYSRHWPTPSASEHKARLQGTLNRAMD